MNFNDNINNNIMFNNSNNNLNNQNLPFITNNGYNINNYNINRNIYYNNNFINNTYLINSNPNQELNIQNFSKYNNNINMNNINSNNNMNMMNNINTKFNNNMINNNLINNTSQEEKQLEPKDYLIKMFGRIGWICKQCNNFNFETRNKCNRCLAIKNPKSLEEINKKKDENKKNKKKVKERKTDWLCLNCQNLNYGFRKNCNRCQIQRKEEFPSIYLEPNQKINGKNTTNIINNNFFNLQYGLNNKYNNIQMNYRQDNLSENNNYNFNNYNYVSFNNQVNSFNNI
jgi:hypothetical protein